MTNAINIRAMSRSFGHSTALDDITLTVPEGSICGLLGRNGAGKTTIMSILAGQDRPTSGIAEVFGEQPFENESILSRISFVRDNQKYPDNYRLHHVLRIAPEFAPNWNADVAAELIDGFRIPDRTPVKKFSRGQLSAIAIVLGLASRAPLTLLGGGGGDERRHSGSSRLWLWPLPPPGPIDLVAEWRQRGIAESRIALDGGPLLAGVARVRSLWS